MHKFSWLTFAKQTHHEWEIPSEIFELFGDMAHDSVFHDESIIEHVNSVIMFVRSVDYQSLFPELNAGQIATIENILALAAALHDIGKPEARGQTVYYTCPKCGRKNNTESECKNCGNTQGMIQDDMVTKYHCRECGTYNKIPQCADCGKSDNLEEVRNATYFGHELIGYKMSDQFLQHVPSDIKNIVKLLTRNHMVVGNFLSSRPLKFKMLDKMLKKRPPRVQEGGPFGWINSEIFMRMSLILSMADHMSRSSKITHPADDLNSLVSLLDDSEPIEKWDGISSIPYEKINSVMPALIDHMHQGFTEFTAPPPAPQISSQFVAEDPNISNAITNVLEEEGIDIHVTTSTKKDELFKQLALLDRKDLIGRIVSLSKHQGS